MRTKSFLIAAISVTSLLLVAAGIALAKKPDKPPKPEANYVVITFADNPTDAIQSDGRRSYDYGDAVIRGKENYDYVIFKPRKSQIYYNISDCLSGDCPEQLEGFARPHFEFYLYRTGGGYLDMEHEEVGAIWAPLELYANNRENINIVGPTEVGPENARVQAFDTDTVEGVDHWVFTIPVEGVFEVRDVTREGETEFSASVPFTFTADLY